MLFALALASGFVLSAQKPRKKAPATASVRTYLVEGTMTNDSLRLSQGRVGKLYLSKIIEGQEVKIDSAIVKDKHFRFEGKAPSEFAEIAFITGFDNGSIQFILEPGKIRIEPFDARFPLAAKAVGTANNDVFRAYKQTLEQSVNEARRQPRRGFYTDLPDSVVNDQQAFLPYHASNFHINGLLHKTALMRFVKEHLASPVVLYVIRHELFYMFTPKVIERQYLRALPQALHKHPMYLELQNQIKAANLAVGKEVPDIEAKSPEGKTIKLSELKGKYVLIDFWASWCAPCRREFPHLKEAMKYSEGKDNFMIYSFSLDNKAKEWTDCIAKNQLTHKNWVHTSDLKGWGSKFLKLFNVTGVPRTVLIAPSGKVIAFDLRGEEFLQKVKRLMDGEETYE